MFFHWEMRIGIYTYTSDTHSQRQYTHLSIQTQTYSKYRHGNSNLWKNLKEKHFFYHVENKFNLLDIHNAIVLCYEMPFFLSVFTHMIFMDRKSVLKLTCVQLWNDDQTDTIVKLYHLLTLCTFPLPNREKGRKIRKKKLKYKKVK